VAGEYINQQSNKLSVAMYQAKVMTKDLYVDVVTLVSPVTAILFGAAGKVYGALPSLAANPSLATNPLRRWCGR